MKKLAIAFVALMASAVLMAQNLQNPSFESWSQNIYFEEPQSFQTSNVQAFFTTMTSNVNKSNDHVTGNYSAHLSTIQTPYDTIPGMMLIGTPSNNGIDGGIPFNQMVDSIHGRIKYNIMPGDTGFGIFIFKKNGVPIAMVGEDFVGTQLGWIDFYFPVNLPVAPDTIAAILISSNMDYAAIPGSEIYIDGIELLNNGTVIPFPNGDMELWTPVGAEEPEGWDGFAMAGILGGNVPVTKSTDAHLGSFALRIESIISMWGDTIGYCSNGTIGSQGPRGGDPINQNPLRLTGWYKYSPFAQDTALVGIWLTRWDIGSQQMVLLEENMVKLSAASTYTYFEVNLNYAAWPYADTINVSFASGNLEDGPYWPGSVLLVDDLNLVYAPVGMGSEIDVTFGIYPNPASDMLNISFKEGKGMMTLSVYDNAGKQVLKTEVNSDSRFVQIPISHLTAGMYTYSLEKEDQRSSGKIVIQ